MERLFIVTAISVTLLNSTMAFAETTILEGETLNLVNPEYPDYQFYNTDAILNYGTLNNAIDLINEPGSTYANSGVTNNQEFGRIEFRNGSVLTNTGNFSNYGDVSLQDYTRIENHGVYDNYGGTYQQYGGGFEFNNTHILNNSGLLNAPGVGSQLNNSGTIVNTGEINGNATVSNSGLIDNYGHITNTYINNFNITRTGILNNGIDAPAPIPLSPYLPSQGVFRNEGVLNNDGVINNNTSNYGPGGEIQLTRDGVINNTGTINNSSFIVGGDGQHEYTVNLGTINNTGTINNDGMIIAEGMNSSGTLLNDGVVVARNMVVDGGNLGGTGSIVVDGTWNTGSGTGNGIGTLYITESGTLAPRGPQQDWTGAPVDDVTGQLDIYGNLALDGSLQMDIDLSHSYFDDGYYDSLHITGNLFLGATSTLDVNFLNYGFSSDSFDLISAYSITGEFSNNLFYHDYNWYRWDIIDGDYQDIVRVSLAAVPLPAAFWLFFSGLIGLAAMAKGGKNF